MSSIIKGKAAPEKSNIMPIVKNENNKRMNNKMNKTGKTKSQADYPIWIYQSLWFKIISKLKQLFAIADEEKKTGKKDLANFVLSCLTKTFSDLLENT